VHLLQLQDAAPLGVEYVESFFDSYFRLADSFGTFRAVVELLDNAILMAETVPLVRSSPRMRILRTTTSDSGLPALRLYFTVEDGTLTFMHVEHYDENEPLPQRWA
jgi:hypothetical protein